MYYVAGVIPSELCGMPALELDVSDTDIQCYSGCLTSSSVFVTGASDDCHNGSIMQRFLIVLGIGFGLVLTSTVVHRHWTYLNMSGGNKICIDICQYIGYCFSCVSFGYDNEGDVSDVKTRYAYMLIRLLLMYI